MLVVEALSDDPLLLQDLIVVSVRLEVSWRGACESAIVAEQQGGKNLSGRCHACCLPSGQRTFLVFCTHVHDERRTLTTRADHTHQHQKSL